MKVSKQELSIVGIEVRTTNENGQAAKDIPALWRKFMHEGILDRIPNKIDDTIYALYTDYESDHTKPYTTVLGCKVDNLDNIPEDFTVKIVPSANYQKFEAKGDLTQNTVIDVWMKIWNTDLKRTYTTDIEIYDDRAVDPTNAIVDILIAVE